MYIMDDPEGRRRGWSEIPSLPDELFFSSILSHLTMKQVARTSLVSRNWLRYWRHISILNFDNPSVIDRMMSPEVLFQKYNIYCRIIREERRDFINWVDNILDKHMGTFIEEFKVTFYLENSSQDAIDKWVVWALSKHVQRLHIDFTMPRATWATFEPEKRHYALDKPILDYCFNTLKVKPLLTSLCLKSVNVSDLFIEHLFESCGNKLDKLWVQQSEHLTSIKSNNASLSLRYLTIINCKNLDTIEIKAPKLESFKYVSDYKHEFKLLHIANASSLSYVSLHASNEDHFFYVLRSLSNYFPQFLDLTLHWYLNSESNTDPMVDYFPELAKLKHLKMYVRGYGHRNIAGWVPFIRACPLLEKLTMQLSLWFPPSNPKIIKWYKRQLIYLKTFEIMDFNGINVDVNVANFVFENATALETVIFQGSEHVNMRGALRYLKLKIPENVKLGT